MKQGRRAFGALMVVAGAAAAGAVGPVAAQAGAWPTQTVRLVVAYPPGGSTDVAARLVAVLLHVRAK